ncbi:esterase-like activity of phytase family protein [Roseateles sp. BYS87W]|uniref:Esterase-like activity of phytase family protein n=1 Tax=Pelomonas baiyunensis TaxID=3299026 RepID=A0ABW7GYV4_9BURK
MRLQATLLTLAAMAATPAAHAQTALTGVSFVNGLTLAGNSLDLSSGSDLDRRVGFFSDIYYDRNRNEWWGLSDRGPGGGVLPYDTRVQRFTVDVNANTGAISNFRILETVKFSSAAGTLNGQAPTVGNVLGRSFDPEGFVVNPVTGNFLVSDEYGPSVYEFSRSGQLIRAFKTPANLVPRTTAGVDYNALPPAGSTPQLTQGRLGNRGLEGLAITPDGRFAYAMLQNGLVTDGYNASSDTRGLYTRIIKYDIASGEAVGQYAYALASASQGRGSSALVALDENRFLVLERNNRGIGVGATLSGADKNVFEVDLRGATDVTGINLPSSGALPSGLVAVAKGAQVMDLDANTLAALGNKSPEKWEGLAVGPRLADGRYLVLAGTDNDYSVTQNGAGTQFDVYFRMTDADPYAKSIQCPMGQTTGCFFTANSASATLTGDYQLLPGVLHAYTANIANYAAPVPEPAHWALMTAGLGLLALTRRKAR